MADQIQGPGAVDRIAAADGGLRDLLERLRSHLGEQWPVRLQYR
jgi:hypothetical protein